MRKGAARRGKASVVGACDPPSCRRAPACVSCATGPPAPPPMVFGGLPVAGDRALFKRHGFDRCVDMDAIPVRCKGAGAMLFRQGRYEAGVAISGSLFNGPGGATRTMTASALSSSRCSDAAGPIAIRAPRRRANRRLSSTGPVRMWMAIRYWSIRRLRIIPQSDRQGPDQPAPPIPVRLASVPRPHRRRGGRNRA